MKYCQHGFLTLTGGQSVTVTTDNGWSKIKIKSSNDSLGNITLQGITNRQIGNQNCSTVVIEPGDSEEIGDYDTIIGTIIITCAANTTAYLSAISVQPIIATYE
jgi:predicted phage tail protein